MAKKSTVESNVVDICHTYDSISTIEFLLEVLALSNMKVCSTSHESKQKNISGFLMTSLIFPGLAAMVLLGPINAIVAKQMKALQIAQMKNKDKRNKMMDEILNGMKILKLYAWEASFADKVN